MEQLKNNTVIEAHNIKEPVHECDIVGSFSSSSSSSSSSSASGISTGSSLEFDAYEEVTSSASASSSSSSSSSSPSSAEQVEGDPLNDMSSLFQQLPIKRGLSKYYQGKSQSFTSLAKVRSLEDLAKPENPYNKKLKSSISYGGGLGESETHGGKCSVNNNVVSRHVSKKGSCSSLSARRGSANFVGSTSRPPIPPQRSTSTSTISNQTALFA